MSNEGKSEASYIDKYGPLISWIVGFFLVVMGIAAATSGTGILGMLQALVAAMVLFAGAAIAMPPLRERITSELDVDLPRVAIAGIVVVALFAGMAIAPMETTDNDEPEEDLTGTADDLDEADAEEADDSDDAEPVGDEADEGEEADDADDAEPETEMLFAERISDGSGLSTVVSETGELMVFAPSPGEVIFADEDGAIDRHDTGFGFSATHIEASEEAGLVDIGWIDEEILLTVDREGDVVYRYESGGLWDMDSTPAKDTHVVTTKPLEGPGSVGYGIGGEVQWTADLDDAAGESVVVSDDGSTVVVGVEEYWDGEEFTGWNGVRVYDEDGSLEWEHETDEAVLSVAIDRDEDIVVAGTDAGETLAFDLDGEVQWHDEERGGWIQLAYEGETIVTSEVDGSVVGLGTDGAVDWEVDIGFWAAQDFAISDDGTAGIFANRGDGHVVVIQDGEVIWEAVWDEGPAIGDISADGDTWTVMVQDNEDEDSLIYGFRYSN